MRKTRIFGRIAVKLLCLMAFVGIIMGVLGEKVYASDYDWSTVTKIPITHAGQVVDLITVNGVAVNSIICGNSASAFYSNVFSENVTDTNAKICAKLTASYSLTNEGFYISRNADMSGSAKIEEKVSGKATDLWYEMNKWYGVLESNTTYYYQFFVVTGGVEQKSDVKSFTTSGESGYYSNVFSENVTDTDAKIYAKLTTNFSLTNEGFYISKNADMSGYVKVEEGVSAKATDLWYEMNKWYGTLDRGTTYYYRIFIVVNGVEHKSDVRSFKTTCSHSYNAGVVTTAPTCVSDGVRTYSCTVCGAVKNEVIARTGVHSYQQVVREATATSAGWTAEVCTVCGDVKNKNYTHEDNADWSCDSILYTGNAGENDYGLSRYDYRGKTINSHLITNADGTISRVEYSPRTTRSVYRWNREKQAWERTEELVAEEKLIVENYNAQYELLGQIELQRELEKYVGFYSGSDYNWFVFGQANPEESDSVEVYRIVKYTKDWQRVGQGSLYGANTYQVVKGATCVGVDQTSLRMAEYNGKLFIRTCRTMYASSDGNHHQANITIQVDENRMETSYTTWAYVSHSFDQFIDLTDGMMTAVDLGDAYPRSVVWFKYPNNMSNVDVINKWSAIEKDIFDIAPADNSSDASAYNATGVSVGGYEVTTNNYLVALSSVDQSDSHNQVSNTAVRDVYIATLSKTDYARNINRITEYTEGMAGTPQLVKIDTDKYILMWNYHNNNHVSIRYVMIDGDGKTLTQIYSWGDGESDASLSDCKPIVVDGRLIWYSTFEWSELVFYELDCNNLAAGIKTHKKYTHEFSSDWSCDSEKHWHRCTLGRCDGTVADEGQHIESDWIIDYDADSYQEGEKHKECTVCGYVTVTEKIKEHYTHRYSTTWTYDSEKHWHRCTLGRCDGTVADEGQHIASGWIVDYNATSYQEGKKHKECTVCGYVITTEKIGKLDNGGSSSVTNGWYSVNGERYWYENGVRQGVRYNADGSIDSTYRGKEIYDPSSNAWYWLDCVQNGAVAKNKDVYQESSAGDWGDITSITGEKTGKWVRYDSDGHMIKGWQTTGTGTYYFDPVYGTMAKGQVVIDGQSYYFNRDTGVLVEGGAQTDDAGNSFLTDGWHKVSGVNYWYENGVRQGVRYNADGSIDTSYRGKEIYDPATNAWYWLDNVQQGAVAKNKDVYQESAAGDWGDYRIDGVRMGKWVRYDSEGHMIKGWQTTGTGTYYFDPVYGTMAKGEVVIDGQRYYFDVNTGVLR